jgi:hypothetical protein
MKMNQEKTASVDWSSVAPKVHNATLTNISLYDI